MDARVNSCEHCNEPGPRGTELPDEFKLENLLPKTSSALKCEKVNELTFKITNGELTNVPASHGQWGGCRTTKTLAWIIRLGSEGWVARRNQHKKRVRIWFRKDRAQGEQNGFQGSFAIP